jgi:hypothetical protein
VSTDNLDVIVRLRNAAKFARDLRNVRKDVRRSGQEFRVFGTMLRVTALGAIILAQGIGALGLATIALGSSLAPLIGLLGAIPGLLTVAVQGFAVLQLGMGGITDAVGGLNESIDPEKFMQLSRPAKDFALVLDAMKRPLRGFRDSIQAAMLPGFAQGMIAARPALDALKGPLTETGGIFGAFATDLGRLVGSRGFMTDLRSQAQFNNVQLSRLSGAGLHLVNVFRNLMVGSRGLVSWLVRLVSGWAATADRTSSAALASGAMADRFHTIQVTTSRVLRLVWRFGKALFNIGAVGKKSLGDGILLYLLRGATQLERWTRSEAGVRKLTGAFVWARDVLRSIGDFMDRATGASGAQLAGLLRNVVAALNPILASGGGPVILGLWAEAMASLAGAAAFVVNNVPGATSVISALLAVMILSKLGAFRAFVLTLSALGAIAGFLLAPLAGLSTAFWALNAAIAANPIGLAVIAIAALAAGIIWAYQNVKWFRNAVQDTWQWITDNWQTLALVLTGPFAPLILAMKWVINNFEKIKDFLSGLPGKALNIAKSVIPGLAAGGVVKSPLQIIGEHGPELAALPMGTRVIPAAETQRLLRAPHVPRVPVLAGAGLGGQRIIRSEITVKLDRKVLAKAVADTVDDERAGG